MGLKYNPFIITVPRGPYSILAIISPLVTKSPLTSDEDCSLTLI